MEIKSVRPVCVAVLQDIVPVMRPIVVLVANPNSVLVVYRQQLQHLHRDLQDLQRFVVQRITMQFVQRVFAVVMTVNVVLVPRTAPIRLIAKGSMETAILQRHPLVHQPSTILVQSLAVYLTIRISQTV